MNNKNTNSLLDKKISWIGSETEEILDIVRDVLASEGGRIPWRETSKRHFHDVLAMTILDHMGKGDFDSIYVLMDGLREQCWAFEQSPQGTTNPSEKQTFVTQLTVYTHMMAVYTRTVNDTKSAAILLGKKNATRKEIFARLYACNRPMSISDLQDATNQKRNTIHHNLQLLVENGLVTRKPLNNKSFVFEVSWLGKKFLWALKEEASPAERNTNKQRPVPA